MECLLVASKMSGKATISPCMAGKTRSGWLSVQPSSQPVEAEIFVSDLIKLCCRAPDSHVRPSVVYYVGRRGGERKPLAASCFLPLAAPLSCLPLEKKIFREKKEEEKGTKSRDARLP